MLNMSVGPDSVNRMSFVLQPWQLLFTILIGWVNRRQQQIIEFQNDQIAALLKAFGKKRLLSTDDQRRVLAVKGRALGRKTLQELTTIVTPDTILRWHRELVARKWDYSDRKQKSLGRPPVTDESRQLVLRMARANPTWRYDRIQGALANLGHEISDQTVGNILKAHGIEPAPERKRRSSWTTFLKSRWDLLGAIDFTTVEVWTRNGLITYYLLFVMKVATRRVHFAGCTTNPTEAWMRQSARNLTDCDDGFLHGTRYLLMDRDGVFCASFRATLKSAGVLAVRLPPRSPDLNAHLKRFHGSIKAECLDRLILFGETMLRNAIREYLAHYHGERNHQGLDNRIIDAAADVGNAVGTVESRERLGGMLRYYHRKAA
jgi:putative transposase